MDSQIVRLQWGCIFLLLCLFVGCSLQTVKAPEGEKGFFQETSRLEKLAREHPETSVRARSHLQLALLYVNYRNPQLNYNRALQEMESYFSLVPTKEKTDDVQNWFAVLKEVGKLQTSMERMQKANKSLRDEVAGLKDIDELIGKGLAYRCDCPKERIDALRQGQMARKEKPRYDGHCRGRQIDPDQPHAVRFRNPDDGLVLVDDLIRGRIAVRNDELDDLVIRRTDGSPPTTSRLWLTTWTWTSPT